MPVFALTSYWKAVCMSSMANPMDAIIATQQALDSGAEFNPNDLDAGYYMVHDKPGIALERYCFVKVVDKEIQVMSIFGLEDPINGITCYNVSYAVKESHRGRGLAIEAVTHGLEKLTLEMKRNNLKRFCIEAFIDRNNVPSLQVAKKLFPDPGRSIIDDESGTPAIHFLKLVII